MYCKKCGAQIADDAKFCPSCGASVNGTTRPDDPSVSRKSRLIALLLCWFLGCFGAHRFYTGRPLSAVFMILTIGGLGIWALVDLIVILCGDFKDSDGKKLLTWLDQ